MDKVVGAKVTLVPGSQQLSIEFQADGKPTTLRLGYDDAWGMCLASKRLLIQVTVDQVRKQPAVQVSEVEKLPRLAPGEFSVSRIGERFLFAAVMAPKLVFPFEMTREIAQQLTTALSALLGAGSSKSRH